MELSNEEKKAIELLKNKNTEYYYRFIDVRDAVSTLLNLTDKQQKEIEEKNCLIDVLQHRIEELLDNKKEINYIKPIDIPVHNYISKDKIRERIKEARKIKWHTPKLVIEYFEELLEENNAK